MDGIAIKAMVSELAPVVREYVEAAQAPLLERIAALETEKGTLSSRCEALEEVAKKPLEIDLTQVEKLIEAEIAKLPPPPKEIDREELAEMVSEAVATIPAPQDGKSVTVEDVAPLIAAEVEKATDPRDINLMVAAEVAKAVEAIPQPKDGRGVKDLLIDRDGNLVATMDDGEMKMLGPVIGKDGEPGKDGRDGVDLTSFEAQVLEDDRTVQFKFVSGEFEHIASLKWPTMIYRGVFKEGSAYEQGDAVSWGGSVWVAERATNEKPDTAQSGWKLAVKKGMKGADAPSVVAARANG